MKKILLTIMLALVGLLVSTVLLLSVRQALAKQKIEGESVIIP